MAIDACTVFCYIVGTVLFLYCGGFLDKILAKVVRRIKGLPDPPEPPEDDYNPWAWEEDMTADVHDSTSTTKTPIDTSWSCML